MENVLWVIGPSLVVVAGIVGLILWKKRFGYVNKVYLGWVISIVSITTIVAVLREFIG